MSFLYSIIILPIETIIEFIFCFVLDKFEKFGVAGAIVAVSLAVNFLALPIYNVADEIQLKERELQKRMSRWIKHIKKTFKGDEQFMMLNAYYRENKYHPLYALRQSLSIMIEVPFFIAAYHFLSHCSLLENQSILFLKDLSKPDAFVTIGGFSLNLLPILMTAINMVSSIIYTKNAPLREKIQVHTLAVIFLVLLYNSPSGLVFYWILNNLFSLFKNIVNTTKNPNRIWHIVLSVILIFVSEYVFLFRPHSGKYTKFFLYLFTLVFAAFPFIKNYWKKLADVISFKKDSPKTIGILKFAFAVLCLAVIVVNGYYCVFKPNASIKKKILLNVFTVLFALLPFYCNRLVAFLLDIKRVKETANNNEKNSFLILILSCSVLAVLCGLLLPSSVIATSPTEFSFLGKTESPMSYVWSSFAFFTGLFVFWPLVIYKMFDGNKKVKVIMLPLFFVMAVCALANAFLFKYNYGTLSLSFTFNSDNVFKVNAILYCFAPVFFFFFIIVLYFCLSNKKQVLASIVSIVLLAQIAVSIEKIKIIKSIYSDFAEKRNSENFVLDENSHIVPQLHLSKNNKNVVILFIDRAISSFFPYILEQFPKLKNDFEGFVYYPNCISFGAHTVLASPAMLGGYEYTATEMNKRDKELLEIKHNEALLVLPMLFVNAGFEGTIIDVPFTNYKWDFEKDVFENNIPNIKAFSLEDKLGYKFLFENKKEFISNYDEICDKRIKKFCILETMYPPFRKKMYNDGKYYSQNDIRKSKYPESFINSYSELFYLADLTATDAEKSTLTILGNGITHYESLFTLVGNDYQLGIASNSSEEYNTGIYDCDGLGEVTAYQLNATALLQISKWLNFLKENNVYDNTRIIIVSDHGYLENYKAFRHFKNNTYPDKKGSFNPLFLVKDFDSHGEPYTDNAFMSNAETPVLAIKDLPISDINPFTGKQLKRANDFDLFKIISIRWDEKQGKGNPYLWKNKTQFIDDCLWSYTVRDNIFDESNWTRIDTSEAAK